MPKRKIEKLPYSTVSFDLKPPNDAIESTFNTLILIIDTLRFLDKNIQPSEQMVRDYNEWIERAKKELDNLKKVIYKEEK